MPSRWRILFVTSNGTGLGHLTRSMAIARRLDPSFEPLFITFSAGAPVVAELGFPVEYLASYDRPGAGNDWHWTRRTRARLAAAVEEAKADVILFDGTHPLERLLPAMRSGGAPLVWCRRAMWKPDAETAPLWRSHLFDAVLEPGEFAGEVDVGPTVARRGEAQVVDPIVLLDRSDLVPRAEAEQVLGLDPGRVTVLVQLGQGKGVREANRRCLRHLAARGDVQVAALASTLATLDEVPEGVIRLRATYPISRYLAAFDAAVVAAGYNAYHELIHLGIPALYVPMRRDTDDQAARARYADEHGVGKGVEGPDDPALEAALEDLLAPDRRMAIRNRLEALGPRNGAADAARWLEAFAPGAAGGSGPVRSRDSATSPGGRRNRGLRELPLRARRAWIFVASVPRTVVRLGRQVLTRPRVRTVVVALGFEDEDLAGSLRRALDGAGERVERTLVITDSLDFAPLLSLGVGFEQVPAPGARQAELAGVDYEKFAFERIRLALAERPRPQRVLALGDVPDRLIEAVRSGFERR